MADDEKEPTVADMIARAEAGDPEAIAGWDRLNAKRERAEQTVAETRQGVNEMMAEHDAERARKVAEQKATEDKREARRHRQQLAVGVGGVIATAVAIVVAILIG